MQLKLSTFGLCRWAKCGLNLGCYACRVLLLLGNIRDAPYEIMYKHDVIHKTGSALHIATPLDEDRAMTEGNMHNTFSEVRPCVFRVMRTDRQTNRQTDKHTHYNTFYCFRAEVITNTGVLSNMAPLRPPAPPGTEPKFVMQALKRSACICVYIYM